jgi:DNA-binding Lrp family transcriptional regulator
MASPSTLEGDADRNALGPILAGEETVREAAARLGVSRQAVVQRLKRYEVTCTVLKSQARFIHARAVLRRAMMSRV